LTSRINSPKKKPRDLDLLCLKALADQDLLLHMDHMEVEPRADLPLEDMEAKLLLAENLISSMT